MWYKISTICKKKTVVESLSKRLTYFLVNRTRIHAGQNLMAILLRHGGETWSTVDLKTVAVHGTAMHSRRCMVVNFESKMPLLILYYL